MVAGKAFGSVANEALKGTGTFVKSESQAFGDALGQVAGDGASAMSCGDMP